MADHANGVKAIIMAQFVFYFAPSALLPSLYLYVRSANWGIDPSVMYSTTLTVASAVCMVTPVPFGAWADLRGEREVYIAVTLAAAGSGVILAMTPPAPLFASAWAALSMAPSLRGVRSAYLARNVAPEELSRCSQLASSAGLAGAIAGPTMAACTPRGREGFEVCAMFAAISHAVAALALSSSLPAPVLRRSTSRYADYADAPVHCERSMTLRSHT